jgi:hypothetical protein
VVYNLGVYSFITVKFEYTNGLELDGSATQKIVGRIEGLPGGRSAEINLGAEQPVELLPRSKQLIDLRFVEPKFADHPLTMDLISLISHGHGLLREPVFSRQHIEKRSRSLRVVDPLSGNIVCISGFGLIKDMRAFDGQEKIIAGEPEGDRNLEQLDFELDGLASVRFGNLQYQADGSVYRSGGNEPLGGYRLEALRRKVEMTKVGQAMLSGKAIVPQWLFTAGYRGTYDRTGELLGVGAYEIPPHLLEPQLAEIALWLRLNGVENKLYENFIFNANLAARAMHEKDFVHSQLHRGNVFADLDNGLMPIITDFTTARSIEDFDRLPVESMGGHSPYQANKALDLNILNSNLIKGLMYAQNRRLFPDQSQFLGLLPPNATFLTSEIDNITHCMAWAYAAHLSPDGRMPSASTIGMIEETLRPKVNLLFRAYRDPRSPENTIDTVVQGLSFILVQGLDPQPWHSEGRVIQKFFADIAASYKGAGNRRRH